MSTKADPGEFDCYAKLAPDEPYFVLRAKDPSAPALVELWAALREAQHGPYAKLTEARECADAMQRWRSAHVADSGIELEHRMLAFIAWSVMDKPPVAEPLPPSGPSFRWDRGQD